MHKDIYYSTIHDVKKNRNNLNYLWIEEQVNCGRQWKQRINKTQKQIDKKQKQIDKIDAKIDKLYDETGDTSKTIPEEYTPQESTES